MAADVTAKSSLTLSQLFRAALRPRPGVTVVSLDGQWLKVIQTTGRGSRTIVALLAVPIADKSDDEIATALQQACSAAQLAPGPVLIANSSQFTTARLFTLPSIDYREIADIVELQAEKHTPYTKEEVLKDFKIIDRDASGYSRVLLVISHREIVHRAVAVIERLKWSIERVGSDLEGIVNWLHHLRGESHRDTKAGAILLADIDRDATTIAILHQGKPYLHRSIAPGASQLVRDPAWQPLKLMGEFQRSVETFEAEGLNVRVTEILLTGQTDAIASLQEQVRQGTSLPTSIVGQFERCTLTPEATELLKTQEPVSFVRLLGLALAPSTLDLTPTPVRLRQSFEARAKTLVVLGCQLLAVLLLLSSIAIGTAYQRQRYLAKLTQAYRRTASGAAQIEQTLRQIDLVEGRLANRGQLLAVIAELSQRSPSAIVLSSLIFTQQERVVIKGTSKELPKVYEYVGALTASPLFKEVNPKSISKRKVDNQDVAEFELLCPLAPSGAPSGG
ncbi:MAG: pilus assembly protein PilM [Candidatus Omnitrophica bacterium]|nr:pilus assembly protein PilM [Candidatus Omnitrophota bacterium]